MLALYDAVCNVDFTFTTNSSSANIRMAEVDAVNVGTGLISIGHAYGIAPDPNNAPAFSWGDTWFDHDNYNRPVLGGFAFACGLMHEIGHALGLKHGHDAQPVKDAGGVVWWTAPALSLDHDSLEYTIMTYRSYPGAPAERYIATNSLPRRCRTTSSRCNIFTARTISIIPGIPSIGGAPPRAKPSSMVSARAPPSTPRSFSRSGMAAESIPTTSRTTRPNAVINLRPAPGRRPHRGREPTSILAKSGCPHGARLHRQCAGIPG